MKVKKKGFTITELVIVIAVIAILAAVLIPTFSNVIEKANQTAASSSCNVALSEYIAMVTLDGDPDNNDVTGVVFSSNNYYYVYDGEKLNYIGNSEKDNAKLLAVTSFDTDITPLTGFTKQSVEEGTAVYEGKMKFTIGEQSVEVDLSDTTRTLYLYNVDIDGTTYAGFFTINNTYGGSGNVIQAVNYSYQSGISQDQITVGQAEVSEEVELVLEGISAQYLSNVPIYTGDNKTVTPEEVKVTATYQGNIKQLLSANLYTLDGAEIDTTSVGERIVTVIYSEDTSITTQFSVNVTEKQTRTYYFFNSNNWQTPHAYVWREEYISVKPAVGDFVLMGNILGEENAWTVDGSVKMFYNSSSGEYVVKGLKIANGQQFKIGKVISADRTDIWTLNSIETNENTQWTVQVPAQDAGFTAALVGNEKNIVLNSSSETSALYDIYWKSNNVLYIAKSTDQTAENQPNVAIISTYPNEWPGVPMEPATDKGTGWWQIDIDTRAQFVVFNDGTDDDNNKTGDIAFDGNPDNVYYCNGGWSSSIKTTTYYFYNAAGWENVYAYYWIEGGLDIGWHGVKMTAVEGQDGWFSIDIDDNFEKVVFNDGTEGTSVVGINQTVNLKLDPSKPYCTFENWYSEKPTMVTYYYYNVNDWTNVYAYAWSDPLAEGEDEIKYLGTNRGLSMKALTGEGQEGWYSITVDANATYIKFNLGDLNVVDRLELNSATPYFDGYEWKIEQTTHQHHGGAATCTELAICEVCGQEYGELGSHSLQYVESVQPTCTESGIIEHWKCTLCKKLFSDSGAENEITDVTAPAKGHTPGSEWKSDENYHWNICSACNELLDKTAHDYDNGCDTDCNVCGKVRETTHNYETKYDETYHWKECSVCKQTTENVEHVWNEGVVTKDPTCTEAGEKTFTCECGATKIEEIPMLPHNPDLEWTSDGTSHWHTCGTCQQQLDKAEHVFDQKIETEDYLATAATCTNAATYYYSCECGAVGLETFEIDDALGHLAGEKWFADETNHWKQCTRCQVELSKSAHTGGTATCTKQATCEICNNAYGALGEHNFVNNVCQRCDSVKYYFYNFGKWSDVYAYAWTDPVAEDETASQYLGVFPGTKMTADTENAGWYYIVVDGYAKKIIFNNGKNDTSKLQTNDLDLDSTKTYYCIMSWKDVPNVSNIVVLDTTSGGDWGASNAVLKLYYWNATGNGWIDFQSVGGTGTQSKYFVVSIAACEVSGFKLVRKMNGATENSFENVWNETNDMTVSGGLYITIPADDWNLGNQSAV